MHTILFLSSLFLALTYLALHLGAALHQAGQALYAWRWQRSPAGRLAAAAGAGSRGAAAGWLLPVTFLGVAAGIGLAGLVQRWLSGEWALLVFTVLGLGLEELREPRWRALIPLAAALIEAFRQAASASPSLWLALESAAQSLPEGEVRQAVQRAARQARRGLPPERCLRPLRRLSPHLDEFVINLKQGGWTATPALDTALAALAQRMRAAWSRAGQERLLFDRLQSAVRLGSAVASGTLLAALWSGASRSLAALHGLASPAVLAAAALAALGMVLALRLVLTQAWLRRALATSALAVAVLLLASSPASPAQAETLSLTVTPTATAPVVPTATPPAAPARTPTPAATAQEPAPWERTAFPATPPASPLPPMLVPTATPPDEPFPTPPTVAPPPTGAPTPTSSPTSQPTTAAPTETPPRPPSATAPILPGETIPTPPAITLNP